MKSNKEWTILITRTGHETTAKPRISHSELGGWMVAYREGETSNFIMAKTWEYALKVALKLHTC